METINEWRKVLYYLETTRRGHYCNDDDDYYSCPKHSRSWNHDPNSCTCGADEHNAELDEIIDIILPHCI